MFKGLKTVLHNLLYEVVKFVSLDAFTSKDYGISDLLLYNCFVRQGIILNNDGSLLKSFWIRGQDFDSSTNDEQDFLSQYVNMAMCKLGSGWVVHMDVVRLESVGYIRESDCHFQDATSMLIDEERRFDYKLEGSHYENVHVISFTWLPPKDIASKVGLMFVQKDDKSTKVNYEDYLDVFEDKISNITGIMKVKFKFNELTNDEMLSYLNFCVTGNWLNLKNPPYPHTEIRFVVANQDIVNGFDPKVGDKYIRAISFGENFPAKTVPTMLKELSEFGFSCRWVTRFLFLDKDHAEKMINKIADLHFQGRQTAGALASNHFGGDGGKINRSADKYFDQAEEAREVSETGGVRFGKYTSTLILYDTNKNALAEKTKIVETLINNLNFLARVEKAHCFEAYLGSLPSMARANLRKWIMHTTNLADLLPTTAIWAGYKENPCRYYQEANNNPPLFYAQTTGNTPFRGCLHSGDIGHTLVAGSSRGGKSVLLSFLATQHTRYKNANEFYFDNGYSTLPLCFAMNGTHYDIGSDESGISFKPLEYLDTDEDYTFANDWIVDLLRLNGLKVTSTHKTIISECLNVIRKEGTSNQRTLTYFTYLIKSKKIPELYDILVAYTKSSTTGLQSTLFDSEVDHLSLSNFTVFELQNIMKRGDEVLIPAITYLIHMIERNSDGSPTVIYFDEFWQIGKSPLFQAIIDELLRKIAKKNIAIVLATTQISDVLKSDIFDVLMDNCKTKILLPNPDAIKPTTAEIYYKFGLNEKQVELLAYAIPQQDYYFMSPNGDRMFNLNFSEIAMTFLTHASMEDIKLAKEMKAEHGDLFGYYWLKNFGINDATCNLWMETHKMLTKNKGQNYV